MTELHGTSPRDLPGPFQTHALFGLSADDLEPEAVTGVLGITPHRSFRRGDKYEGQNRAGSVVVRERSSGLWSLVSTRLVRSLHPADHVRAVVDAMYPAKDRLLDFCTNKGVAPQLWIHHARAEDEMGYTLDDVLVQRLGELHTAISISCDIIRADAQVS